ncbi:MAG: dihydrodipicolinate synthase family protein [Candidatus Omnitrophica bacterium]|nr:dihydrodipicolinate synthase family protein [Candidatus Omnitrophota bacterium]
MKKPFFLLKSIALVLVFAFIVQDLSYAAPEILRGPATPFSLPSSLGTIEERQEFSGRPSIILIQDAHVNESAQKNIAKIIDIVFSSPLSFRAKREISSKEDFSALRPRNDRMGDARYVFLEAGSGNDSLSFLRKYAPLETRKRIADKYLNQGLIQGPDYLDLTSDKKFMLWGVEDKPLYRRSLRLYAELKKKREAVNAYLDKIERAARTVKKRVYSPELYSLDEKREAQLKGEIQPGEYFESLIREGERLDLPTHLFPHLKIFKKIKAKERRLQRVIPSEPLDFARGKLRESRDLPEDSSTRPVLRRDFARNDKLYLSYLEDLKSLKTSELLKDQETFEKLVFIRLAEQSDARYGRRAASPLRLWRISQRLEALRRLFNMQFTSDDTAELLRDPKSFDIVEICGFLNARIMEMRSHYEDALFLEPFYEGARRKALHFYRLAGERDERFIENMLKKIEDSVIASPTQEGEAISAQRLLRRYAPRNDGQQAILIVGGYHADNLKRLLRRKGIGYISVIPQLSNETNQNKYEDILLSGLSSPKSFIGDRTPSKRSIPAKSDAGMTRDLLGVLPAAEALGGQVPGLLAEELGRRPKAEGAGGARMAVREAERVYKGNIVPVPTPLTGKGELDKESIPRLVDHLTSLGVEAILVMGATGEFNRLGNKVRLEAIGAFAEAAKGKLKIYANATGDSKAQTLSNTQNLKGLGVEAIVIAPMYYLRRSSDLEAHVRTLSEVSDYPIVLYNNPGLTSEKNINPSDVEKVKAWVHALKDSSGDLSLLRQYAAIVPTYQGDERQIEEALKVDAVGAVASLGNISHMPQEYFNAEDANERHRLQLEITALSLKTAHGGTTVQGLKAALHEAGVFGSPASAKPRMTRRDFITMGIVLSVIVFAVNGFLEFVSDALGWFTPARERRPIVLPEPIEVPETSELSIRFPDGDNVLTVTLFYEIDGDEQRAVLEDVRLHPGLEITIQDEKRFRFKGMILMNSDPLSRKKLNFPRPEFKVLPKKMPSRTPALRAARLALRAPKGVEEGKETIRDLNLFLILANTQWALEQLVELTRDTLRSVSPKGREEIARSVISNGPYHGVDHFVKRAAKCLGPKTARTFLAGFEKRWKTTYANAWRIRRPWLRPFQNNVHLLDGAHWAAAAGFGFTSALAGAFLTRLAMHWPSSFLHGLYLIQLGICTSHVFDKTAAKFLFKSSHFMAPLALTLLELSRVNTGFQTLGDAVWFTASNLTAIWLASPASWVLHVFLSKHHILSASLKEPAQSSAETGGLILEPQRITPPAAKRSWSVPPPRGRVKRRTRGTTNRPPQKEHLTPPNSLIRDTLAFSEPGGQDAVEKEDAHKERAICFTIRGLNTTESVLDSRPELVPVIRKIITQHRDGDPSIGGRNKGGHWKGLHAHRWGRYRIFWREDRADDGETVVTLLGVFHKDQIDRLDRRNNAGYLKDIADTSFHDLEPWLADRSDTNRFLSEKLGVSATAARLATDVERIYQIDLERKATGSAARMADFRVRKGDWKIVALWALAGALLGFSWGIYGQFTGRSIPPGGATIFPYVIPQEGISIRSTDDGVRVSFDAAFPKDKRDITVGADLPDTGGDWIALETIGSENLAPTRRFVLVKPFLRHVDYPNSRRRFVKIPMTLVSMKKGSASITFNPEFSRLFFADSLLWAAWPAFQFALSFAAVSLVIMIITRLSARSDGAPYGRWGDVARREIFDPENPAHISRIKSAFGEDFMEEHLTNRILPNITKMAKQYHPIPMEVLEAFIREHYTNPQKAAEEDLRKDIVAAFLLISLVSFSVVSGQWAHRSVITLGSVLALFLSYSAYYLVHVLPNEIKEWEQRKTDIGIKDDPEFTKLFQKYMRIKKIKPSGSGTAIQEDRNNAAARMAGDSALAENGFGQTGLPNHGVEQPAGIFPIAHVNRNESPSPLDGSFPLLMRSDLPLQNEAVGTKNGNKVILTENKPTQRAGWRSAEGLSARGRSGRLFPVAGLPHVRQLKSKPGNNPAKPISAPGVEKGRGHYWDPGFLGSFLSIVPSLTELLVKRILEQPNPIPGIGRYSGCLQAARSIGSLWDRILASFSPLTRSVAVGVGLVKASAARLPAKDPVAGMAWPRQNDGPGDGARLADKRSSKVGGGRSKVNQRQTRKDNLHARASQEPQGVAEVDGTGQSRIRALARLPQGRAVWPDGSGETSRYFYPGQYRRGQRPVSQKRVYPVPLHSPRLSLRDFNPYRNSQNPQLSQPKRFDTAFSSDNRNHSHAQWPYSVDPLSPFHLRPPTFQLPHAARMAAYRTASGQRIAHETKTYPGVELHGNCFQVTSDGKKVRKWLEEHPEDAHQFTPEQIQEETGVDMSLDSVRRLANEANIRLGTNQYQTSREGRIVQRWARQWKKDHGEWHQVILYSLSELRDELGLTVGTNRISLFLQRENLTAGGSRTTPQGRQVHYWIANWMHANPGKTKIGFTINELREKLRIMQGISETGVHRILAEYGIETSGVVSSERVDALRAWVHAMGFDKLEPITLGEKNIARRFGLGVTRTRTVLGNMGYRLQGIPGAPSAERSRQVSAARQRARMHGMNMPELYTVFPETVDREIKFHLENLIFTPGNKVHDTGVKMEIGSSPLTFSLGAGEVRNSGPDFIEVFFEDFDLVERFTREEGRRRLVFVSQKKRDPVREGHVSASGKKGSNRSLTPSPGSGGARMAVSAKKRSGFERFVGGLSPLKSLALASLLVGSAVWISLAYFRDADMIHFFPVSLTIGSLAASLLDKQTAKIGLRLFLSMLAGYAVSWFVKGYVAAIPLIVPRVYNTHYWTMPAVDLYLASLPVIVVLFTILGFQNRPFSGNFLQHVISVYKEEAAPKIFGYRGFYRFNVLAWSGICAMNYCFNVPAQDRFMFVGVFAMVYDVMLASAAVRKDGIKPAWLGELFDRVYLVTPLAAAVIGIVSLFLGNFERAGQAAIAVAVTAANYAVFKIYYAMRVRPLGVLRKLIKRVGAIGAEQEKKGLLENSVPEVRSRFYFTERGVAFLPQKKGRLVVIGDLHGDYWMLKRILKAVGYDARRNKASEGPVHLVFVGDYWDVGKRSFDVIRKVLELKCGDPENITLLRGNHDTNDIQAAKKIHDDGAAAFFMELQKHFRVAEGTKVYSELRKLAYEFPSLLVTGNGIAVMHAAPPARAAYSGGLLGIAGNAKALGQLTVNIIDKENLGGDSFEDHPNQPGQPHYNEAFQEGAWWVGLGVGHFMRVTGVSVILRGHDRNGDPENALFGRRLLTVISTGAGSPDYGYRETDIRARYVALDLDGPPAPNGLQGAVRMVPISRAARLAAARLPGGQGRAGMTAPPYLDIGIHKEGMRRRRRGQISPWLQVHTQLVWPEIYPIRDLTPLLVLRDPDAETADRIVRQAARRKKPGARMAGTAGAAIKRFWRVSNGLLSEDPSERDRQLRFREYFDGTKDLFSKSASASSDRRILFQMLIESVREHARDKDWEALDSNESYMRNGDQSLAGQRGILADRGYYHSKRFDELIARLMAYAGPSNLEKNVHTAIQTDLESLRRDIHGTLGKVVQEVEAGELRIKGLAPPPLMGVRLFFGRHLKIMISGGLTIMLVESVRQALDPWIHHVLEHAYYIPGALAFVFVALASLTLGAYLTELLDRPIYGWVEANLPSVQATFKALIYHAIMRDDARTARQRVAHIRSEGRRIERKLRKKGKIPARNRRMFMAVLIMAEEAFDDHRWYPKNPESMRKIDQILEEIRLVADVEPAADVETLSMIVLKEIADNQTASESFWDHIGRRIRKKSRHGNEWDRVGVLVERARAMSLLSYQERLIQSLTGDEDALFRQSAVRQITPRHKQKYRRDYMQNVFRVIDQSEGTPIVGLSETERARYATAHFYYDFYRLWQLRRREATGKRVDNRYRRRVFWTARLWEKQLSLWIDNGERVSGLSILFERWQQLLGDQLKPPRSAARMAGKEIPKRGMKKWVKTLVLAFAASASILAVLTIPFIRAWFVDPQNRDLWESAGMEAWNTLKLLEFIAEFSLLLVIVFETARRAEARASNAHKKDGDDSSPPAGGRMAGKVEPIHVRGNIILRQMRHPHTNELRWVLLSLAPGITFALAASDIKRIFKKNPSVYFWNGLNRFSLERSGGSAQPILDAFRVMYQAGLLSMIGDPNFGGVNFSDLPDVLAFQNIPFGVTRLSERIVIDLGRIGAGTLFTGTSKAVISRKPISEMVSPVFLGALMSLAYYAATAQNPEIHIERSFQEGETAARLAGEKTETNRGQDSEVRKRSGGFFNFLKKSFRDPDANQRQIADTLAGSNTLKPNNLRFREPHGNQLLFGPRERRFGWFELIQKIGDIMGIPKLGFIPGGFKLGNSQFFIHFLSPVSTQSFLSVPFKIGDAQQLLLISLKLYLYIQKMSTVLTAARLAEKNTFNNGQVSRTISVGLRTYLVPSGMRRTISLDEVLDAMQKENVLSSFQRSALVAAVIVGGETEVPVLPRRGSNGPTFDRTEVNLRDRGLRLVMRPLIGTYSDERLSESILHTLDYARIKGKTVVFRRRENGLSPAVRTIRYIPAQGNIESILRDLKKFYGMNPGENQRHYVVTDSYGENKTQIVITLKIMQSRRDLTPLAPLDAARLAGPIQASSTGFRTGISKLNRIRGLLLSLGQELEKRNLKLAIRLHGVYHDWASEWDLGEFDFVTLELPNSVVRKSLQNGLYHVDLRNKFWRSLLRALRAKLPRRGAFGINESTIRYPRHRLLYDELKNPNGKRTQYVRLENEAVYNLRGMGSRKKVLLTGREVLNRLPPDLREEFNWKGIVHVRSDRNPFGGKNLVLFRPPSESVQGLMESLKQILIEEFSYLKVEDAYILESLNVLILAPVFMAYNDQDQVERMLERVRRSIRDGSVPGDSAAPGELRLLHVGGYLHNEILRAFLLWAPIAAVSVSTSFDARFPEGGKYPILPGFIHQMVRLLDNVRLVGDKERDIPIEVDVTAPDLTELIRTIVQENKDYLARRILMDAIQDEAQLSERWMKITLDLLNQYGSQALKYEEEFVNQILAVLTLDDLRMLNDELSKHMVFKTSPRLILEHIVDLGIMDMGEMNMLYTNSPAAPDPDFITDTLCHTKTIAAFGTRTAFTWGTPAQARAFLSSLSPTSRLTWGAQRVSVRRVVSELGRYETDPKHYVEVRFKEREGGFVPTQIEVKQYRYFTHNAARLAGDMRTVIFNELIQAALDAADGGERIPFIVVLGLPASGKTTLVRKLVDYLAGQTVVLRTNQFLKKVPFHQLWLAFIISFIPWLSDEWAVSRFLDIFYDRGRARKAISEVETDGKPVIIEGTFSHILFGPMPGAARVLVKISLGAARRAFRDRAAKNGKSRWGAFIRSLLEVRLRLARYLEREGGFEYILDRTGPEPRLERIFFEALGGSSDGTIRVTDLSGFTYVPLKALSQKVIVNPAERFGEGIHFTYDSVGDRFKIENHSGGTMGIQGDGILRTGEKAQCYDAKDSYGLRFYAHHRGNQLVIYDAQMELSRNPFSAARLAAREDFIDIQNAILEAEKKKKSIRVYPRYQKQIQEILKSKDRGFISLLLGYLQKPIVERQPELAGLLAEHTGTVSISTRHLLQDVAIFHSQSANQTPPAVLPPSKPSRPAPGPGAGSAWRGSALFLKDPNAENAEAANRLVRQAARRKKPGSRPIGSRLAEFFKEIAHAHQTRKEGILPVAIGNQSALYRYKKFGRAAVIFPVGRWTPFVILDTKAGRVLSREGADRLVGRVNARVLEKASAVAKSNRLKIYRLQGLSPEMAEAFTAAFKKNHAADGVFLKGDQALSRDLEEKVTRGEAIVVNLMGMDENTKPADLKKLEGRLVPFRRLEEGDVPAAEAIMAIARAVGDARREDAGALSAAWKELSGLRVPPEVLWRIINRQALLPVILRHLLAPVVSLRAQIEQKALTRGQTLLAA